MSLAFVFDPGLNGRWRPAVDAHKVHAAAEWPREACGLVDAEGAYRACRNVAAVPETDFEVAVDDLMAVDGGRPAAVLHSHVSGVGPAGELLPPLDAPSAADMRAQLDMAVPWGISLCLPGGAGDPFWFGDQVPRPPLIGRPFRHGIDDCYALIRDWHREVAAIALPDYPRDPFWWDEGAELYDQFESAGFARVHRAAGPLMGDVFLCRVRSPVLNHGGVCLDGGLILHHLQHQLSMRAPATVWRAKLDFLVRHRDLPEGWVP